MCRSPTTRGTCGCPRKLGAELPGILAWIVALAAFLADEAVIAPRAEAAAEALYRAYVAWSEKTGERVMGQRALALRLGERGFKSEHRRTGNVWVGIGVRLPVDGPVVPSASNLLNVA